jgi:hypothetical protein
VEELEYRNIMFTDPHGVDVEQVQEHKHKHKKGVMSRLNKLFAHRAADKPAMHVSHTLSLIEWQAITGRPVPPIVSQSLDYLETHDAFSTPKVFHATVSSLEMMAVYELFITKDGMRRDVGVLEGCLFVWV